MFMQQKLPSKRHVHASITNEIYVHDGEFNNLIGQVQNLIFSSIFKLIMVKSPVTAPYSQSIISGYYTASCIQKYQVQGEVINVNWPAYRMPR